MSLVNKTSTIRHALARDMYQQCAREIADVTKLPSILPGIPRDGNPFPLCEERTISEQRRWWVASWTESNKDEIGRAANLTDVRKNGGNTESGASEDCTTLSSLTRASAVG